MAMLFTGAAVLFSLFSLTTLLRECAHISVTLSILLAVVLIGLIAALLIWGVRATRRTGQPLILVSAGIILIFGLAAFFLKGQIVDTFAVLFSGGKEEVIPQIVGE